MKDLFDFIYDNFFSIFCSIFLVGFAGLIFIFNSQLSEKDLYDLEKSCYEYYKENGYILESCSKYADKIRSSEW